MLPKKKRLTKADFSTTKTKVVFRGKFFTMAVSPQKETKISCVISKKTLKKATERNKARRRLYEFLRKEEIKNPQYIVIYPRQDILAATQTEIQNEIREAFDTL